MGLSVRGYHTSKKVFKTGTSIPTVKYGNIIFSVRLESDGTATVDTATVGNVGNRTFEFLGKKHKLRARAGETLFAHSPDKLITEMRKIGTFQSEATFRFDCTTSFYNNLTKKEVENGKEKGTKKKKRNFKKKKSCRTAS